MATQISVFWPYDRRAGERLLLHSVEGNNWVHLNSFSCGPSAIDVVRTDGAVGRAANFEDGDHINHAKTAILGGIVVFA